MNKINLFKRGTAGEVKIVKWLPAFFIFLCCISSINAQEVSLMRIVRSPFAPPVVTAFNPGKRSGKHKSDTKQIGYVQDDLQAPFVNSQSKLPAASPHTTKPLRNIPRTLTYYSKSYSPIVSTEEKLSLGASGLSASFSLQNDLSLINNGLEARHEKLRSGNLVADVKNSKRSSSVQFPDYKQVLKAIDITNGELQKVLREKRIKFHDFLDFVERGATKDQILELIYRRNDPQNLEKKVSSVSEEVPFKNSYEKQEQGKFIKIADVMRPPRDSPLVTHFASTTKRKELQNELPKSASILSVSIVQPDKTAKTDKETAKTDVKTAVPDTKNAKTDKRKISKHNMYIRNKLNGQLKQQHSINSDAILQNNEAETSYQQLRLVFPVQGILIFCGALGLFAMFTILILIIYGSVKCSRKKPVENNYQVNERIELTSEQCQ